MNRPISEPISAPGQAAMEQQLSDTADISTASGFDELNFEGEDSKSFYDFGQAVGTSAMGASSSDLGAMGTDLGAINVSDMTDPSLKSEASASSLSESATW